MKVWMISPVILVTGLAHPAASWLATGFLATAAAGIVAL
jgi:hypothetical protein